MHGYQIWVALPKEKENIIPNFQFYKKEEIPQKQINGLTIKLVAGNGFGMSSPLQGYSPLFMVDIFTEKETTLDLRDQIQGEVGFVIVKGSIISDGQKVGAGQMLINVSSV